MTDTIMDDGDLSSLIERGGIYHNVPGATPQDLLAAVINCLPPMPWLDVNELYRGILEREALVSTGIGKGIALPHPRNPMTGAGGVPFVAVIFPAQPLDWNAPDGKKVHTVFLIVSVSTKQHLATLSKINFLCQQEEFYSLITAKASEETFIMAVRKAETSWAKEI